MSEAPHWRFSHFGLFVRDLDRMAELLVIQQGGRRLGNTHLTGCDLYVTLEPCPMCAGALVNSRIGRLVYGATDPKAGAAESLYGLLQDPRLNHQVELTAGLRAAESAGLLRSFFAARRSRSGE